MILQYDPATSLRHWPTPMSRFGTNAYGDNLYRIVFAPSRRFLVCGKWPDGSDKASYQPKYPQLGDTWVMERWLPAEEYAKCSKEYWNANLLILGPYPDRGEYELCHAFELSTPDDANIEKLVAWIEEGRRVRFVEKLQWHRDDHQKEKKQIGDQQEAMILNWLPAFGTAPMSGYGGGRSQKSAPITRTAQELGLPTQGGQLRTRKPRPTDPQFAVPVTV